MRRVSMRNWWVALLLVPFLVVGCDSGGGTGPEDADLTATADAMESAVQEFLIGNKALLSIAALANAMVDACGGSSFYLDGPFGALGMFRGGVPSVLVAGEGPQAISEDCLGESFVMNASGDYVTGGTGSVPADGVRFQLYDVNNQGRLITPLVAIGYMEIVDSSTDVTIAGSIEAVVNGQTLIDFTGVVSVAITTLNLDAEGFFSADGSTQMDVTLEGSYNIETGAIAAEAGLETADISATMSFSGNGSLDTETLTGTFDARIDYATTTVVLDGGVSEAGILSGDVRVNGSRVATFTVDSETGSLNLTDVSNGTLTSDDMAALQDMFNSALNGFAAILTVGLMLFLLSGF